ncbi:tetratricopeptide repeat protein [Tenacibaculum tangerinum]|uniref:Tetratricopeptide repeat protein n=1 Tax=Tenacibaculum tangerinum TaxID=3038772 RepID=A0ABY8L4M3_9FLAO|nr:tetratricopeptide repeat protein [Tenacibaculum tangerinum]WGH75318.1 tetratricopeptide repeat protein [Tenacibaculum tangerinum]
MKNILFCVGMVVFTSSVFAQKNAKVWEALLKNNRVEALKLVEKLEVTNDLENLILSEVVRVENGMTKRDPKFLKEITNYKHFENYMFSHWTQPYFFTEYLDKGFNAAEVENILVLDAEKVPNTTIKSGLKYIQAIGKRYIREWDEYNAQMQKINAVTDWEFCGVFENLNSSGIDMPYPPEGEVSDEVIFDAQSNGDAKWYKSKASNEVYNFFTNHSEYGTGVHYAQTFIVSPIEQRIQLKLGKKGLTRVWLNDVLILEDDENYFTELDAFTVEVTLQKGINRVLLKQATKSGVPYFIVRLEDVKNQPLTNYTISFDDRNYVKCTANQLNPKPVNHSVEVFFKNKLSSKEADVNLTTYSLFNTYYRNGKINEALALANEWAAKYPESSLIKLCQLRCYQLIGENTSMEKIKNNMKLKDPSYYMSYMYEYENFKELAKLDIEAYEAKMKEIANSVDYSYMKTASDLLIYMRRNDKNKIRNILDKFLEDETIPSKVKPIFAGFYASVFEDAEATIKVLEKFHKAEFNTQILNNLVYYYKKQNRMEDALNLYLDELKRFDFDNDFQYWVINLLHDTSQYKRSLPYIEKALENYPNSYLFTKLKGDVYEQLGKKQEAVKLYEKALSRSTSQNKLREKINDLKKIENPLNEFDLKDPYAYIKENRKTVKDNNYGLNTLLEQTNVLGYERGGAEYHTTLIYEITSQNGIDIFKEYDLGLSGYYMITKSEIVKPSGETIPADKNGSNLVFHDLAIGDVVYIHYEAKYSSNGRFYKDHVLTRSFPGYHPVVKNVYRYLTPEKEVTHVIKNGELKYSKVKRGDYYVHQWEISDAKGIPVAEDYMPEYNDVVTRLHISSIKDWNAIATWYSDIVRKQLRTDQIVKDTYQKIFPKGHKQLTETERAKKIYYYITDTLNYSHVSFRQGGYVPQKPSKTITTKLGDCKDFSSLFLVLGKLADLDTRMVLILTSDYGKDELILPSTDFNHCIVKVKLDGKEQFLELTDKYLPFRALPTSLRDATGLEIPFDSSDNFTSELFKLHNVLRMETSFESTAEILLKKPSSDIELTSKVTGSLASYYIDALTNKKGQVLKDAIQEEINERASEKVKFVELKDVDFKKEQGTISNTTKLTMPIPVSKIGKLQTFAIPHFTNPYNSSIIEVEERSYPIDYKKYENSDSYKEVVIVKLGENEVFQDVPENSSFSYKAHEYNVSYELLNQNALKVTTEARTPIQDITVEEYADFKDYITKILETRNALVSYKVMVK